MLKIRAIIFLLIRDASRFFCLRQ